jgi:CelD/BcsL family acetyltransferase involved in cellulose biosynthesis
VTAKYAIEDITDAASFAALEAEWWSLWQRCPSATPFQSPAWLLPWWRHFGPGSLRTVAIRQGGELVLLAPFYLEDGPLARRLLPVGISLSDYLDILVDPAVPEAVAALVTHLDGLDDWDRLELEELAPGASALALSPAARWSEESFAQSGCPTLLLRPEPLEDLLPRPKLRKIRMSRNRAERRGPWHIRCADGVEETMEGLNLLVALHGARWSMRGEEGVLNNEQVQAFQRATVPRLEAAGLLRIWILEFGEVAAAAVYELVGRDWVAGYLTGFSPEFEFESPGTLLLAHVIEHAAREGYRAFHFLRGQESYKYSWGAADRWNTKRSLIRQDRHHAAA